MPADISTVALTLTPQPTPPVVSPTRITYPGGTSELRTARQSHPCTARDHYPHPCPGRIKAGEQYIRSVMFPNHDASGYLIPVAHATCLSCAVNYLHLMDLATHARPDRKGPT